MLSTFSAWMICIYYLIPFLSRYRTCLDAPELLRPFRGVVHISPGTQMFNNEMEKYRNEDLVPLSQVTSEGYLNFG